MDSPESLAPIVLCFIAERRNLTRELNADAVVRSSSQGRVGERVLGISEDGCKLELDVDHLSQKRFAIRFG